jgi:hypothetical protein
MHPYISKTLANLLAYAPTSYIHSWLLYFGIEAALPDAMQDFAPLYSYCEFLNALHVYADEARRGVVRHVEAAFAKCNTTRYRASVPTEPTF